MKSAACFLSFDRRRRGACDDATRAPAAAAALSHRPYRAAAASESFTTPTSCSALLIAVEHRVTTHPLRANSSDRQLSGRISCCRWEWGLMGRTTKMLNPAQTGREARKLEDDLRQRVVGQDEAIR